MIGMIARVTWRITVLFVLGDIYKEITAEHPVSFGIMITVGVVCAALSEFDTTTQAHPDDEADEQEPIAKDSAAQVPSAGL